MSRCPAHGGEFRKGVLVTLIVPGKGVRGARVCQDCANGGMLVVASKLPPVIEQKTTRPEGYANALRQLQVIARAARASAHNADHPDEERFYNGRAEGFEGAIEVIKREMGQ